VRERGEERGTCLHKDQEACKRSHQLVAASNLLESIAPANTPTRQTIRQTDTATRGTTNTNRSEEQWSEVVRKKGSIAYLLPRAVVLLVVDDAHVERIVHHKLSSLDS
jgi:hypothetical protein